MTPRAWRTVELRWILPGETPDSVETWFGDEFAGLGPDDPEERIEQHLVAEDWPDLIVKFANNNLEIKRRESRLDPIVHEGRPVGRPEIWAKWIWPMDPAAMSAIGEAGRRIEVRKTKRQRRILLGDGEGYSMPRFDAEGRGFFLELTAIEAASSRWWSLAFDVHPDRAGGSPRVLLERAVAWSLTRFPAGLREDLRPERCFAQPHLIAMRGAGEDTQRGFQS